MADKTLYDILEISPAASPEVVLAAYERLSEKYDPQNPENSGNPDSKIMHSAVEEAYFTIKNPEKRAQYDKKLEARNRAMYQHVEIVDPFWTMPKLIMVALIIIIGGGYYYDYAEKKNEARLAAETAIAEARAREAAEKVRGETEQARLMFMQQQQERMTEERNRREREQALRQFSNEQRTYTESASRKERQDQQRAELQRQREEQQAAAAARNLAAKEKAELCRIERERYGRAISC
ncbi:MAG: DnaJ domain-containing protein [Burkholderiales bacterium]|nr:DnaJ domain-containing protein [Burkholderiales bacterium]MCW5604053.1 DnaJ domain-containing protein [Burkholderiales bacterium]